MGNSQDINFTVRFSSGLCNFIAPFYLTDEQAIRRAKEQLGNFAYMVKNAKVERSLKDPSHG